ncbi:MAG: hypothetical protein QOI54_2813 [Actinomycetota bacterium]|nr:hypothetical protein [Actinomycetota bacterium]
MPVRSPARVAVLDDYQGVALSVAGWTRLDGRATVTAFRDHLDDPDALVARLEPYDVVVAMRERTAFPRELLQRLPHLRLLVTTAMGNAAIDMEAAGELGIAVCGTDLFDRQTVELTWALVMAATRGVAVEDRAVREGRWQTVFGRELAGRTMGLLGLGHLGRQIAHIAQFFGMHVVAWSEHLTPLAAAEVGVTYVGFDELFERSDVVSVHLRLSDRTRGLVGIRELRLLGPQGFLVNTSRGPIVVEADLVQALNDGVIAGAALDVYDTEPLPPGHPLMSTPRTTLSPHNGFVAERAYQAAYGQVVEDIAAWLDGSPLRVIVEGRTT